MCIGKTPSRLQFELRPLSEVPLLSHLFFSCRLRIYVMTNINSLPYGCRGIGIGAHLEKNRRTRGLARAIDIHEGEEVDASAFKALVRQAVALNSSARSKPSKKSKS